MCDNVAKINLFFLLKTLHRKGTNERVSMWRELNVSSTFIGKFHIKHILFHAFLQTVDKQKYGEKIKKLKSEKPKEGREATLLSESGFDLGNCLGKKIKIEEQKNKGGQGSNSSVRARFRSWDL